MKQVYIMYKSPKIRDDELIIETFWLLIKNYPNFHDLWYNHQIKTKINISAEIWDIELMVKKAIWYNNTDILAPGLTLPDLLLTIATWLKQIYIYNSAKIWYIKMKVLEYALTTNDLCHPIKTNLHNLDNELKLSKYNQISFLILLERPSSLGPN